MPQVCSAPICTTKTWGFPSLLSRRSDLQSRKDIHHFLVLTLQCSPSLGQPQDTAKATTWKDLHFTGVASSTAKAKCQTDNKEAFQKVLLKLPFQPCPELGHEHQRFWKQKDARFFHYCNINKLLLEQQELDTEFLTDLSLAFCLLLPPIVLTEVTLALLFYFHPTGDSTSPSQSSTVIFECQPVLPNHNKQRTHCHWENVRGCLLLASNSYGVAITVIFDISYSFQAWMKLASGLEATRKEGTIAATLIPYYCSVFLAVKIIYTITSILVKANAKNTYSSTELFLL